MGFCLSFEEDLKIGCGGENLKGLGKEKNMIKTCLNLKIVSINKNNFKRKTKIKDKKEIYIQFKGNGTHHQTQ